MVATPSLEPEHGCYAAADWAAVAELLLLSS